MSLYGELAADAAVVEAEILLDRCTVSRSTADPDDPELDPVTLEEIEPEPVVIYEDLPCLYTPARQSPVVSEGGAEEGQPPGILDVPPRAELIRPGDLITITTTADPALLGAELRAGRVEAGTFVVTRQIEVMGPEYRTVPE